MCRPKKTPTLKLKISEEENTTDSLMDNIYPNEDSNQSGMSSVTTPVMSHPAGDAKPSLSPSLQQSMFIDINQQVEGETVDVTSMEVTNHVEVKQDETGEWAAAVAESSHTTTTEMPSVEQKEQPLTKEPATDTTPVKVSGVASIMSPKKMTAAEKPSTRKSLAKKSPKTEPASSKTSSNQTKDLDMTSKRATRAKDKKSSEVADENSTEPLTGDQHKTPDSTATSDDHPLKMSIDERETLSPPGGVEQEPMTRRSGLKSQGGKTGSRTNRLRSRLEDAKEPESGSKPSETESEDEPLIVLRERKLDDSIPNSPASICQSDTEEERVHKTWKKSIMLVWRAAANHKFASIFLHPVTEDIAPGYSTVVLRPMDLQTIRKNIDNGLIRTTVEFQRDMMLMFTNALMYNSSDSDIFKMSKEMYTDVLSHIEQFVNTQLLAQTDQPKMLRTLRRSEALSDKEEETKKRRISEPDAGGKGKKRKN